MCIAASPVSLDQGNGCHMCCYLVRSYMASWLSGLRLLAPNSRAMQVGCKVQTFLTPVKLKVKSLVRVPYLTGPHFLNLFGSGSRSRGSRGDEVMTVRSIAAQASGKFPARIQSGLLVAAWHAMRKKNVWNIVEPPACSFPCQSVKFKGTPSPGHRDSNVQLARVTNSLCDSTTWLTRPVGWCCALCCEGRFCQLLRWFMFFSTKKMALMLFWCCLVRFLFNVAVGHPVLHSCHANATPQAPPNWTRQVSTSPQYLVASDFSLMPEEPCRPVWEMCSSVLTAGASRCQGVHRGFIDRTHGTLPRFEKHLIYLGQDLGRLHVDAWSCWSGHYRRIVQLPWNSQCIPQIYHRYHSLELYGFKKTPSSKVLESWTIAS